MVEGVQETSAEPFLGVAVTSVGAPGAVTTGGTVVVMIMMLGQSRAILRLLALAHYEAGAFHAAESTLRVLVDQDPLDADALHMLGQALERGGRAAEAGRYLSLAAALDPAYSVSCSTWGGRPPSALPAT